MRPRQFHLIDIYTETECGEILGGRCLGCGQTAFPSTYIRVGHLPWPDFATVPPKMSRGEYIAWKAMFLGISREEAERSLNY